MRTKAILKEPLPNYWENGFYGFYSYPKLLGLEIVLCGPGQVQEDLEEFFHELNVVSYLTDSAAGRLSGRPVEFLSDYRHLGDLSRLIVVCDFDREPWAARLEARGLKYGRDYIMARDLINTVNEIETFTLAVNYPGRKVIVMGTGHHCQAMLVKNPHLEVEYFIDNDKRRQGEVFHRRPVRDVAALGREKPGGFVVLAAAADLLGLKEQLTGLGLIFGQDFYFYNWEIQAFDPSRPGDRPADLLARAIGSGERLKMSCTHQRQSLLLNTDGSLGLCCCGVTVSPGNICFTSLGQALRSLFQRIVNLSIANKTYCFCNKNLCWVYNGERLGPDEELERANLKKEYALGDFSFGLNYDMSCNLACPSCRTHKISTPPGDPERLELIHRQVIAELPLAGSLCTTGGETLYSRYYRDVIFNHYPGEEVAVISNGLLFTREVWQKLHDRYARIKLDFSIDAATESTYRRLRGGDFQKLMKNMKLAGDLRKKGQVDRLTFRFVVQRDNFQEMPAFAQWGREMGADSIFFVSILNFGSFSTQAFAEVDVCDPTHGRHGELLAVLADPVLKGPDVRYMLTGNLIREDRDLCLN